MPGCAGILVPQLDVLLHLRQRRRPGLGETESRLIVLHRSILAGVRNSSLYRIYSLLLVLRCSCYRRVNKVILYSRSMNAVGGRCW